MCVCDNETAQNVFQRVTTVELSLHFTRSSAVATPKATVNQYMFVIVWKCVFMKKEYYLAELTFHCLGEHMFYSLLFNSFRL